MYHFILIFIFFFILCYIIYYLYFKLLKNKFKHINFISKIQKEFLKKGKINLNNYEEKIDFINLNNSNLIKNIIQIGFTLDPRFILQTMMTVASIMTTQNKNTKIVFHFGVTNNFTAENMIKIYELRKKINNLTEFNFYYLKDSTKKMKNFHYKGVACPGKFELPELIPDDIEKLLIFDGGDVLVFRDLSELFNYNMKEYWALGAPEPNGIYFCLKNYNISKYLNIGSILLNVKKLKKNHFWDYYTKNRNIKLSGARDQTLFNILVPDNKKNYFPSRLGGICLFKNDKDFDNLKFNDMGIHKWLIGKLGIPFHDNPKNIYIYSLQLFNSPFIHQFANKWKKGSGLSIFRNLSKYFIKIAGIWDELCKEEPGYCK